MDIQTKDGILLRGIPDGTPDDAIKARIEKIRAERGTPAPTPFVPSGEKETPSWTDPDVIAGNPVTRFAIGAAKPILGAVQLVENINPVSKFLGTDRLVNEHLAQLEEMTQSGRKKLGSEGFDFTETAGTLLSPVSLKAMKMPAGKTAGERIWQGVALGGGFGATTPVTHGDDFWGSKAVQTVTGAILGGAIPGAIELGRKGGKIVRNLIDPWLPGGVDRAAGRTANEAAGAKRDAVIAALEQNRQIVPGSRPTAGEAAAPVGSAEFSGLQRVVEGRRPSAYFERANESEAARRAAVQSVGKDKTALEAAVSARTAASGENYKEAFEQAVKRDAELRAIWKNPFFKDEVGEAWKIAQAKGLSPRKNLTEFLHFVKEGMDAKIQAANRPDAPAISRASQNATQDVKAQLLAWLEKKNPAYEVARKQHVALSKPINQMKLGQEVEQALVAPVTGAERAGSFGTAVRRAENVVSKATGKPRIQDLTPSQRTVLKSIEADLQRSARHDQLAKVGTEKARDLVGQVAPAAPAAGMFNPKYSVARAILNRIAGRVEGKSVDRLSEAMENPDVMARLMRSATPSERAQIIDALLSTKVSRGAVVYGTQGAAEQEQF